MAAIHKPLHVILCCVILDGQVVKHAGLLMHICPGSNSRFIFLSDLALLIFNTEKCMRTHFKGIFFWLTINIKCLIGTLECRCNLSDCQRYLGIRSKTYALVMLAASI